MKVAVTISPQDYDVVLFDLDGVLTRTAGVTARRFRFNLWGDGEVCDFASGTTRVFRLNAEATHKGGTQ
jgi:phosphoglycolate phosphatase-like HAD superfamily hydrolase